MTQQAGLNKILVQTMGTRGDVQPYIAVACALQARGYTVAMASAKSSESLGEEFGVKFYPCFPDTDMVMRQSPKLMESMARGDTLKFLAGLSEAIEKLADRSVDEYLKLVPEFSPELIVTGSLVYWFGNFAELHFKIPAISLFLQGITYNPKHCVLGFPALPCGLHKYLVYHVLAGGFYNDFKLFDSLARRHGYEGVRSALSKEQFIDDLSRKPPRRVYIASSSLCGQVINEGSPANFSFIGYSVIAQGKQLTATKNFGSERADIERFIKAGTKPIYCGWGSMTCKSPAHMITLVVEALTICKQRAIVLEGWANLNLQLLKETVTDSVMVKYAEDNIYFAKTVSHEWLFPQMACTVHHGGAGTSAVAMRAGLPTIITPVFLDQFDSVYLMNKLGIGIGIRKQFQVIKATELAEAITKVLSDSEMAKKASAVGEQLRKDNGAEEFALIVDKFWNEQVATGKYATFIAERFDKARRPRCICF